MNTGAVCTELEVLCLTGLQSTAYDNLTLSEFLRHPVQVRACELSQSIVNQLLIFTVFITSLVEPPSSDHSMTLPAAELGHRSISAARS